MCLCQRNQLTLQLTDHRYVFVSIYLSTVEVPNTSREANYKFMTVSCSVFI